ncbi:MAG: hypothetical protein JXN62_08625 [Bacteroidales bacterium]|nr:hypothetical protein [Bacteroidales bacterium]
MKTNFRDLRITLSAVIVSFFLLVPFTVNGQAGKANFSGTWALNAEKSDMGQQGQGGRMGGFGGGDFVARQEANLLTVERSRTNQSGETVKTETKYSLDGKESVNTAGRGGESKSVATWSSDGKTLTIVTTRSMERDGQSMEMKTTEAWTLSGPASLSIVSTMNTPNGEMKTTRVYDKK